MLAYMRQNDDNIARMESKIDNFILSAEPLLKDSADFAKSAAEQVFFSSCITFPFINKKEFNIDLIDIRTIYS